MSYHIYLDDLAGNALIERLRANGTRYATYSELERYGAAVIQLLEARGLNATLHLSRARTEAFFMVNSDVFEKYEGPDGAQGVKLKDGVEKIDLISRFRGHISLDVLLAFTAHETISLL